MEVALADLPRIRAEAECIELRLDLFVEPFDLATLLRERLEVPVVVTLRPPDQGGMCVLPSDDRLRVLLQAAELGAEYVDLEYNAASLDAVQALRSMGSKVIISRHDFLHLPPELETAWWDDLAAGGADVVKVVGTAQDVRDCLPVLRVLQRASLPTISIAMGQAGLPSRVLALRADNCLLTYAAVDSARGTAPGQLTLREMRDVYHASRLGPKTAVFGLLGPHVEADRTREYNAWFAADGVDAIALPFPATSDAPDIVSAYRELPVAGWHIHGADLQSTVGQALESLGAGACRQGKVNAIVQGSGGSLEGHWVDSPREQYELWRSATTLPTSR
jgi:3-dehydroquinate dehydratase/shikimate dehydrogenase